MQIAIVGITNQLHGGPISNTLSRPLRSQFTGLAAAEPEKAQKPQNGNALASSFVSLAAANASNNKAPVPASDNGEAKQAPLSSETRSRGFAPSHGDGDDARTEFSQALTELEISNVIWDWTARIQVKKYEIGCSFAVLFFLGEVPSNPNDWFTADNFIGAYHAFVNGSVDRCTNCRERRDLVIEGFVHLNDAIVQLSGSSSLDPSVVEPYSKEHPSLGNYQGDRTRLT
ncbi:tyrosinase [Moniliophthora roreri MCA 2997]|uniref:Tyrosinase n=1 Tax=Moniliophthora roreri (strain MCA 2997) TaxID=1381753 RepID=V2WAX3_MONRO|nr:tyrosinase [Moniliophthora roreri MCA 2997]